MLWLNLLVLKALNVTLGHIFFKLASVLLGNVGEGSCALTKSRLLEKYGV